MLTSFFVVRSSTLNRNLFFVFFFLSGFRELAH